MATDDDPQEADFAARVAAFAAGATVGVDVGDVVAGVGDLVAVNGIVDHAWIQLDVFDGPPPSPASLAGTSAAVQTVSQDTNPASQQWAGHWVGDKVVVDISIAPPANSGLGRSRRSPWHQRCYGDAAHHLYGPGQSGKPVGTA